MRDNDAEMLAGCVILAMGSAIVIAALVTVVVGLTLTWQTHPGLVLVFVGCWVLKVMSGVKK